MGIFRKNIFSAINAPDNPLLFAKMCIKLYFMHNNVSKLSINPPLFHKMMLKKTGMVFWEMGRKYSCYTGAQF